MNANIEINKASIVSSLFLSYEYDETEIGVRVTNHKCKSDAPIHDDLRDAFKALTPHLAMISEMKKKPDLVKDLDQKTVSEELLKKYRVKGFIVEFKKGATFITLLGEKKLSNGRIISFSTPPTDRGTDEDAYEFFDTLVELVEYCQEEILEYMNGKQAEQMQTELFGDEADDFEPEIIDETEHETSKIKTDDAA